MDRLHLDVARLLADPDRLGLLSGDSSAQGSWGPRSRATFNPNLLLWNFEHVDFELKVDVMNKLKLDALKLCKFRDSGFEMYRLRSIEYDKYHMDSVGPMNAELLKVLGSPSKSDLRF